ncbi:MAG: hypothetical protein Q9160_000166 [Pyrenula sp. 1 TL-2023]
MLKIRAQSSLQNSVAIPGIVVEEDEDQLADRNGISEPSDESRDTLTTDDENELHSEGNNDVAELQDIPRQNEGQAHAHSHFPFETSSIKKDGPSFNNDVICSSAAASSNVRISHRHPSPNDFSVKDHQIFGRPGSVSLPGDSDSTWKERCSSKSESTLVNTTPITGYDPIARNKQCGDHDPDDTDSELDPYDQRYRPDSPVNGLSQSIKRVLEWVNHNDKVHRETYCTSHARPSLAGWSSSNNYVTSTGFPAKYDSRQKENTSSYSGSASASLSWSACSTLVVDNGLAVRFGNCSSENDEQRRLKGMRARNPNKSQVLSHDQPRAGISLRGGETTPKKKKKTRLRLYQSPTLLKISRLPKTTSPGGSAPTSTAAEEPCSRRSSSTIKTAIRQPEAPS